MSETPVERVTLNTIQLGQAADFASVEVRRITIAPKFHAGAHWHNGPVFGVIESGSVFFQVGSDTESVLRTGDTFYEPGNEPSPALMRPMRALPSSPGSPFRQVSPQS